MGSFGNLVLYNDCSMNAIDNSKLDNLRTKLFMLVNN